LEKKKDKYELNKWFAWEPVKTEDGDILWLEFVERRFVGSCHFGGSYIYTEMNK